MTDNKEKELSQSQQIVAKANNDEIDAVIGLLVCSKQPLTRSETSEKEPAAAQAPALGDAAVRPQPPAEAVDSTTKEQSPPKGIPPPLAPAWTPPPQPPPAHVAKGTATEHKPATNTPLHPHGAYFWPYNVVTPPAIYPHPSNAPPFPVAQQSLHGSMQKSSPTSSFPATGSAFNGQLKMLTTANSPPPGNAPPVILGPTGQPIPIIPTVNPLQDVIDPPKQAKTGDTQNQSSFSPSSAKTSNDHEGGKLEEKDDKPTKGAETKSKKGKKGDKNRNNRFFESHAENWTFRLCQAIEYSREHGHCNIPCTYPQNQGLANWAKRQRHQYKLYLKKHIGDDAPPSVMPPNPVRLDRDSTLTAERIRALERIGFCWDVRMSGWFARFNDLKAFVASNGNANVPSNYRVNQKLAVWVKSQRHQFKLWKKKLPTTMNAERARLLDTLGFNWNMEPSPHPSHFVPCESTSNGRVPIPDSRPINNEKKRVLAAVKERTKKMKHSVATHPYSPYQTAGGPMSVAIPHIPMAMHAPGSQIPVFLPGFSPIYPAYGGAASFTPLEEKKKGEANSSSPRDAKSFPFVNASSEKKS